MLMSQTIIFLNKINLDMKNFILVTIVYIILFYSSSIAQIDNSSGSTKNETNSGLIFKKELAYRMYDSSYTDVIQLLSLSGKLHALQFRLLINKVADDSAVLIFKDIQKGSQINDPTWLLDYNVFKDPVVSNGASKYEIYVVLYNSSQDGGLLPGDYSELIKVNYKVAHLNNLKNNLKSSMKISKVEASTFNGFSINIVPTRDEFKIYIRR